MGKTFRGKDREKFKKYNNIRGHSPHVRNAGDKAYDGVQRVYCSLSLSVKWMFKSRRSAVEHIKYNAKMRERKGKEPKFERAYYCKACDAWHITTKQYLHKNDDEKSLQK